LQTDNGHSQNATPPRGTSRLFENRNSVAPQSLEEFERVAVGQPRYEVTYTPEFVILAWQPLPPRTPIYRQQSLVLRQTLKDFLHNVLASEFDSLQSRSFNVTFEGVSLQHFNFLPYPFVNRHLSSAST
jgi:hypothetical protein